MGAVTFEHPYVISWNLTYRCNLACEHCYLDAGARPEVRDESFADRSELPTEACLRVIDEIASFAPDALLILTGGEPLLRRDIIDIIRYGAGKNLWKSNTKTNLQPAFQLKQSVGGAGNMSE